MPLTADRVVVELEARLGKYEANVARAEQKFDRAMGNIQKSASRTEAVVSRAAGAMGTALNAVSVIALARGFLSLADAAKTLDAQLRVATRESGSFAQAQEDVRRIATETRAGLDETARLYGRIVLNARELGVTQDQAARATETFTKSLRIAGATTTETTSATIQFAQALASGVLRGDELRSILEASPRFARLLADSLGVTVGALRDMGEEGTLTADKLIRALTDQKFTEGIDAEFRELPVTFDQAMTLVHNAAITTFGAFDRGGEFSTMLANFITDGTGGFEALASSAESAGARISAEFAGLAAIFRNALDELSLFKGVLDSIGGGDAVGRAVQITRDILDPLGAIIRNSPAYTQARDERAGKLALDRVMRGDPFADFPQLRSGGGSARPAVAATKKAGGRPRKGGATKSPLDPEAFAREEAQLNAEILGLKADQVEDVAALAAIELQRLEILRKRDADDARNNKRMTEAEQAKVIALQDTAYALRGAAVIAERDKELAKQRQEAEEKSREAREVNLRYELDALESQASIADTRQDRLALEESILDLLEQQERAELETLIAAGKVADATKARADLAATQAGRREGGNRDFESPMEAYRRHLNRSPDAINDEIEGYVVDELERVQDSIASGLTKALGIKNPLIDQLVSLFIEQVIMRPFIENLARQQGGGGGFLGALFGTIGGIFGFASGGSMTLGGRGGNDRNILALNGRPIANVSRGERLSIDNRALSSGGGGATIVQTFVLDARHGITTPELLHYVNTTAQRSAAQAAGSMGKQVMKNVPARLAQHERDGF